MPTTDAFRRMGNSLRGKQHVRRAINATMIECLEPRRLLASIVVDTAVDESIADNPTTSLREAFAQAALLGSDDEITFDAEVFDPSASHTITLLEGPIAVPGGSGAITVNGIGRDQLFISGDDADRMFAIAAGGSVVLNDLGIGGGRAAGEGGAIHNAGTLMLDNVNLTSNAAVGADGTGGALDGVAGRGGAIYNAAGAITIVNSLVTDNSATGGDGESAIAAATGEPQNEAGGSGGAGRGGAIYSIDGVLNVIDTEFHANSAQGGDGTNSFGGGGAGGDAAGGAVYVEGGSLTIDGSLFVHSSAIAGAGGPGGLAGSSAGNGGAAMGGAIYVVSTDTAITNTDIDNANAEGGPAGVEADNDGAGGDARGGGIYAGGSLAITGGSITDGTARGGRNEGAGAGGSVSVGGNAAGGGIYTGGSVMITGSASFTGNAARGGDSENGFGGFASGGAIAQFGSALEIDLATIDDNAAQGGDGLIGGVGEGGAIYSSADGEITVTDTTIADNIATAGASAIAQGGDGAEARGGGIMFVSGAAEITRSTISGNVAQAGNGAPGGDGGNGGIARGGGILSNGALSLVDSTIYGNAANAGDGGGAVTDGGDGGAAAGGGIYNASEVFAVNVTIANNAANAGDGGFGDVSIGADGAGLGGGVYNDDQATLVNAIIAHNAAAADPDLAGDTYTLVYSIVTAEGGDLTVAFTPESTGNQIGVDPDLGPLQDNGGPTETAAPAPDSPAVNAGSDAGAQLAFGPDGVDQRGFARFVGVVDIGAVEVQPPQIQVKGNNVVIAKNDTSPSSTDHTSFGSVAQGATGPTRTYTVTNLGEATLTLLAPTLPGGYVITEPLDTSLDAGESDTFTVRLTTTSAGTKAGDVTITSDDPDDATFKFRITGTVTSPPPPPPPTTLGGTIRINFQPAGRPVPSGYFADVGAVFGGREKGLFYGWDADISIGTSDRGVNPDQRLDTIVHTQMFGTRTWEMAVPNGQYTVKLVAGDPSFFNNVYRVNVEGQLTVNGTPSNGARYVTGIRTVTVSDGRLTVTNGTGAVNNKYAYIEIAPVTTVPPVNPTTKINFQPAGFPIPAGYIADTGLVFSSRGNGFSYGWNESATNGARDRNLLSDQRLDTMNHMQHYGWRTWELGVANGTYSVKLVAGDAQYFDSVYKIDVEGQLTVNGTPTSVNRFVTATKTVIVTDGRLTVSNALGGKNNKVAYIEVTRV